MTQEYEFLVMSDAREARRHRCRDFARLGLAGIIAGALTETGFPVIVGAMTCLPPGGVVGAHIGDPAGICPVPGATFLEEHSGATLGGVILPVAYVIGTASRSLFGY